MENSQDINNIIIEVKEEVLELKELIQSLVEKQEETIEYVQKNTENLIEVVRSTGGDFNEEKVSGEAVSVGDNKKICEIADTLVDVQKSVEEMRENVEEMSAHVSGVELRRVEEEDDYEEDDGSGDIKITGLVGGVIKYDKEEDYERVKKVVVKFGKVSVPFIEEKCNVSHAKALDFIDMLEDRGVVKDKKGSKSKVVIVEDGDE